MSTFCKLLLFYCFFKVFLVVEMSICLERVAWAATWFPEERYAMHRFLVHQHDLCGCVNVILR